MYTRKYVYIRVLVCGIVHTAAAVELVVWGYELYPAQQTQPGPRHRESLNPCTMSTSERRTSKKAKIVDIESLDGDSSDGVEPVGSRLSDRLLGAEPILPSVIWYE